MKATKYIAAIALLLGLVACQPSDLFNGSNDADAENVEVTFSVQFPEPIPVATKAPMGETPTLDDFKNSIYLCIYGPGDGAFQNWIQATDVTLTTNATSGTTGTFKARLPLSDDARTVHIFVNPPAGVMPSTSDYIDLVMEKMVSTNGEGAYWQAISLPHGIYADPNDGTTAHNDIKTAFTNVQLLRNFAKIIVDGPSEDPETHQPEEAFELKSWALINVPTKGYVAPYTRKENNLPRFPYGYSNEYLSGNWTASGLLSQLVTTDGYKGYMPPYDFDQGERIINTDPPTTFLNDGQKAYMYERPEPDPDRIDLYGEKQTAVLIEIEFQPGHAVYRTKYDDDTPIPSDELSAANTWWYKVELLNDEGNYVPILRNFVYKMHILGLEERGSATAEEAFNGPYFGNISASLETASLKDLSNSKSQIHVDQLDYTFMHVNKEGETILPIVLKSGDDAAQFWFIPDKENHIRYYETTEGVCEITVTKVNVPGYQHAVNSFEVGTVAAGTPGMITITPFDISTTTIKKSILRVKGKVGAKELYRDITITLMSTPALAHGSQETCLLNSTVSDAFNQRVRLQICLPEGLGSSIFPVQIRIEAENNTLSATSPKLPVQTGKSDFDPTRNTFYYIYTINYSDYCWLNSQTRKYDYRYVFGNPEASGFPTDPYIDFYTNKQSGNGTKIRIRDMKGNFLQPDDLILTVTTPNP